MKLETHFHYQFAGYDGERNKETGQIKEVIIVEVMAESEKEALESAKQKTKKDGYYLQKVWECSTCITQVNQAETQLTWLKVMPKMLKS